MKTLLFILFFIPLALSSQIKIEGHVYDESNAPIFGASVYIDGSTMGTMTDEFGFFSIAIPTQSNAILVFRNMGYQTAFIELKNLMSPFKIFLKEDVKELREVVVEKSIFSRKQMLKLFKEQFLGKNAAGRNCIIENEEELYFSFDKKSYEFFAYSDVPLTIKNNYLGYKVEYELQAFRCKLSRLSMNSDFVTNIQFAGNSLFTAIDNSEKTNKRRFKSFEGSTLHFFRNLVENKWDKKSFLLFKGSYKVNPNEHFNVTKLDNGTYKVQIISKSNSALKNKFFEQFNVLFDSKLQSKLLFHVSEFIVDYFGIYSNYNDILLSGDISTKRVGDLLPANYLK